MHINAGSSTITQNISLEGSASFYFYAYIIDTYDCPDIEVYWEIHRADGEREVYTVLNETYHYGEYYVELSDRGVDIWGDCGSFCEARITISPTDMRYNGAMITGVVYLPDCFNSPRVTDSLTLNIQGIHISSNHPSIVLCINPVYTLI